MIRSLRAWFALLAIVAGMFALACGDNGDDNGAPTATPAADGDVTPADGDGDGDGDASDELRRLAEGFGEQEFQIAYNFSGAGEDGTMTIYWKPPDWRMDLGTAEGAFSMIQRGDATYICSSENGGGSCFESPVAEAVPVPFLSFFTEPGSFDALVGESFGNVDFDRSSRTIAGQDATCFSASGEVEGESGEGEFCFGQGGVLLYMSATSAGETFTLEATSASGSVNDADLEPPYEIIDLGDADF